MKPMKLLIKFNLTYAKEYRTNKESKACGNLGFFRSYSMFYLAISRTQYFPIETEEGEVGGTTRERSVSRHVTSTGLVRY